MWTNPIPPSKLPGDSVFVRGWLAHSEFSLLTSKDPPTEAGLFR
jgi:hypothetical protein